MFGGRSSLGFDNYFYRILGFRDQSKSKACLGQRKAMCDHLTKGKMIGLYQVDSSRNIKGTPPIRGQKRNPVVPKIKKWKNKIETRF
jgi:hypothetical protein